MNSQIKNFKNSKRVTIDQLVGYFDSKGVSTINTNDVINIIQPIQGFYGVTAPIILAQIFVNTALPSISVSVNVDTDERSELQLMDVLESFIADAVN